MMTSVHNMLRTMGTAMFACALMGCSDDTQPAAGITGPLYAFSTITFAPDFSSSTEHISFAGSLDMQGKVYDELSIEITGENSSIWPSYQLGEWFLADSATGQLVKYTVDADGKMQESGKLSLTAYGVNSLYWCIAVVHSSTKAFLFDELTFQGFIWNPSTMTISSRVDLAPMFNPTENGVKHTVWRERTPIRLGDRHFAAFKYFDPASQGIAPRSGMIIIDAVKDSFQVVEHPTCGGLLNSMVGADGKIYSSTGITGAAAHYLALPGASAPCMTRFDPDTLTFDEMFTVTDLGALAGAGMVAGGLVGHPGKTAYVQVLDSTLVPQGGQQTPLTLTGSPVWQTYRLDDLTKPQQLMKVDMPITAGIVFPFVADDRTYATNADNFNGVSQVWDFSDDPPKQGVQLSGWGYVGIRIR